MRSRGPLLAVLVALVVAVGLLAGFALTTTTAPVTLPAQVLGPLSQDLDREQAAERASRDYLRTPFPTPTPKPPKPKPKPSPTKQAAPPPAPDPVFIPAPAAVTMACIRKHESGGSYTARNGIYRGAYQLSMTYSDTWAQRAGHGEWASRPADQWPKAVQDAVALRLGKDSNWRAWSDWTSYHCPGFRS